MKKRQGKSTNMKNNLKFLTAITLIFLVSIPVFSQTYISGGNVFGTWKSTESPYIIESDISIAEEGRLVIESGVEVIFTGPFALEIYGRIDVSGTATDSVYFTVQDTTGFTTNNYDGWYGLVFVGIGSTQTENSTLEYTHIEFSAGSGITCLQYSNLEIKNSTIVSNKDKGINLLDNSDIVIENITMANNSNGGFEISYSAPTMDGFNIYSNNGSGIQINGTPASNSMPTFTKGIIHHNSSVTSGGGISMTGGAKLSLIETAIFSNTSNQQGGGIYCGFSYVKLNKVTITDNLAQAGGAISFVQTNGTNPTVSNSILWGNYPDEIVATSSQPDVTYCDVQDGYAGEGNIDANPWFVNAENNNFKLNWAGFPNDSYTKSPCIDNGHPHAKFDPDGTRADMGAYYFHQSITIQPATKNTFENLSVYPNPAINSISIHNDQPLDNVQVCSLSGQVVMEFNSFKLNTSYDVSNLQSGVYIIRINQNNGEFFTKKLIKK